MIVLEIMARNGAYNNGNAMDMRVPSKKKKRSLNVLGLLWVFDVRWKEFYRIGPGSLKLLFTLLFVFYCPICCICDFLWLTKLANQWCMHTYRPTDKKHFKDRESWETALLILVQNEFNWNLHRLLRIKLFTILGKLT